MSLTGFGWRLFGTGLLLTVPSLLGVVSILFMGDPWGLRYPLVWIAFFSFYATILGIVLAIVGYGVSWWWRRNSKGATRNFKRDQ
jgi:hypothetical protein